MFHSSSLTAAVIKMEGGTDFDLRVLEAPTAPSVAGGEASSSSGGGGGEGEGEKSHGDPSRGNMSSQTGSQLMGGWTEGKTGGETDDTKDREKVRKVQWAMTLP